MSGLDVPKFEQLWISISLHTQHLSSLQGLVLIQLVDVVVIQCTHLSIYWCVMFIFVVNKMCLDWMFQSLDNFGYPFHYLPYISAPYNVSSWFSLSTLSSFDVIVCSQIHLLMRIGVANEMCLGWMFQSQDNFGFRDSARRRCHYLLLLCAHIIHIHLLMLIVYWCCKWNVSGLDVPKLIQLWNIHLITYPTSQLPTRSRRDSARRRCRHSLSLCAHISIYWCLRA